MESVPGEGSRFWFTLSLPPLPVSAYPEEPAGQTSAADGEIPPLHIAVAEDNPDNQYLIRRLFQRLGHSVEIAGNGEELLALLRASGASFDMVFLDVQMPVLDGYETARRLRESHADQIVVALTANSMSGDREKALQAGMNDYLSKPVRLNDLKRMIARWQGVVTAAKTSGV